MLEKILILFVLILFCSGCASFSEKKANVSQTKNVTAIAISQARNTVFAPTYQSEETDKYYDAIEIYDSSPKASQGVYRCQGLVFVIICIDTNTENIEYLEGTAMLRTVKILRKHYPGLPSRFHIRNKIVEKIHDHDTGIYRYATVYREKDIKKKLRE